MILADGVSFADVPVISDIQYIFKAAIAALDAPISVYGFPAFTLWELFLFSTVGIILFRALWRLLMKKIDSVEVGL